MAEAPNLQSFIQESEQYPFGRLLNSTQLKFREGNNPQPVSLNDSDILVIYGLPGCGKSTVRGVLHALLINQENDLPWLQLSTDKNRPRDETTGQLILNRELIYDNIFTEAAVALEQGYRVILDGTFAQNMINVVDQIFPERQIHKLLVLTELEQIYTNLVSRRAMPGHEHTPAGLNAFIRTLKVFTPSPPSDNHHFFYNNIRPQNLAINPLIREQQLFPLIYDKLQGVFNDI